MSNILGVQGQKGVGNLTFICSSLHPYMLTSVTVSLWENYAKLQLR